MRNVLTAWQEQLAPAVRKYRGVVYHRECIAHECGKSTAEGKPYCKDHLSSMPYVARLLRSIATRKVAKASERERKRSEPKSLRVAV
jgi:hypothetical protein